MIKVHEAYAEYKHSLERRHGEHIESRKRFVAENRDVKKKMAQMLSSFRRIERAMINCPLDMDDIILNECMKHLPKQLK